MDKKTCDICWAALTKEDRNKFRNAYNIDSNVDDEYKHALFDIFGQNLTTIIEPDEILIVKRSKVQDLCDKVTTDYADSGNKWCSGYISALNDFFGNKCLYDETNGKHCILNDINSSTCTKYREYPQYNPGDRVVNNFSDEYSNYIWTVVCKSHFVNDVYTLINEKTSERLDVHVAWLEPYIKPETKDIQEFELDFCKLLKECIGETFFVLTQGEIHLKEIDEKSITFETNNTWTNIYIADLFMPSGICCIFPSRELFKLYPLDPYTAWVEWWKNTKI